MGISKICNWLRKNPQHVLTIVLILITGYYAWQSHNLNDISYKQLEANSRPYLSLENLRFGFISINGSHLSMGVPGYAIQVINRGKSFAKIKSVEIRSSPTASFKSKEMKTEQWIFPDETLDIRFDKLLNTAGGFFDKGIDPAYMAMNTTSYARVIVKYEWNEKDYSTTRDFSAPFNKVYVVENIGLISSEGFKEIVFDNLNQVFDEPAPIDQAMYNDYLRIMKS